MYKFGKSSLERLNNAHPKLQQILTKLIEIVDFSILCSYRSEEEQNDVFNKGLSKVQYPNSKHNSNPSRAVDIIMYPIDWNNIQNFYYLAGLVKGIAHSEGIKIRWGGDWDSDNDFSDEKFRDFPHFELDNRE